ncbi:ATP-binding domain-containing protein [Sneathiella sp. P13V-1]|uniref:ATP-binding domain-containing protein n=1 Tax=Sneathiella sp. P13V-1 TaxID=2697366 RepID=UPI00187B980D|nr:ATP-binding domain-containing protein [Sneathiella sp. P13V-1]MBE7635954.1 ATP-binding domain-containing protein [Sneathiella sp. P13V-1]
MKGNSIIAFICNNYWHQTKLGDILKNNKDVAIASIATSSLDCIEKVADEAEKALIAHRRGNAGSFAHMNTFNNQQQIRNLGRISDAETLNLSELLAQPIIARVHFTDEQGREDTVFITRNTPRSVRGFTIASYRSPLGRIASLAAGDDGIFSFAGSSQDLLVENTAKLTPRQEQGVWDSFNSEIDIRDIGQFTVGSLRAILEPKLEIDESELESLWEDESDENVVAGVRRAILTHMGLRDQPILDQHQDEIFRMPINSQCFLSGPPGTGKTTTLIRRLGQKTDTQVLEESLEEARLTRLVENDTGLNHISSWVLFSPTELLRQYVKEAFAREGLVASDEHIRTWGTFRRELSRERLGLLRTSAGAGPFIEKQNEQYLNSDTVDDAAWYDDFRSYIDSVNALELKTDSQWLLESEVEELELIGERLLKILNSSKHNFYARTFFGVSDLIPQIQEAIETRSQDIDRILTRTRNTITYSDRNFPNLLREQISKQLAAESNDIVDDEDMDIALEDDDANTAEPQAGQPVSFKQALSRFERALKVLAKAKSNRRKISNKSQNGMLLAWLGPERLPSDDDIATLGTLLEEQGRLRKFERLDRLFLRAIPQKYKRFRSERTNVSRWYSSTPAKSSDIHWKELDLLVLATFQIANVLLTTYREKVGEELPTTGPLSEVRYLKRAQILVDEATDFSRVQLAAMLELAHPATKSFFMCGDVNQRLTSWGVKSNEALDWLSIPIQHKSVTVSYRQSRHLVNFAKDIARLGGVSADDIILPDRVDAEGVAPVWKSGLSEYNETAKWLTERIREIDRTLPNGTTIAILVNTEEQVEPLAVELNKHLEDINLSAIACKDGRVVGNDRDVRVFNLEHIKGLEFEAVFFIDLDTTIDSHPELYFKYLYVGATRAATYLGITFQGEIPEQIQSLSSHFEANW